MWILTSFFFFVPTKALQKNDSTNKRKAKLSLDYGDDGDDDPLDYRFHGGDEEPRVLDYRDDGGGGVDGPPDYRDDGGGGDDPLNYGFHGDDGGSDYRDPLYTNFG